ncbi:MAG: hypothetical protein HY282_15965 [Nitrospirae bacterium]|nr:hypothetical protein [Candidatus Manganitrophaceae bacterium]
MKKLIFILAVSLSLSGVSFGADPQGPIKRGETGAQTDQNQMQPDQEVGNSSGRVTPLGNAGKLFGDVVDVDPAKGTIGVRTTGGKISRIQLDREARGQLNNIKPGDQVLLDLAIEAKAVEPTDRAGASPDSQTDHGSGGASQPGEVQNGAGAITGKVVRYDSSQRVLEIETANGGVNRLELDEDRGAKLKNVQPGDRVTVTLTLKAKSVEPQK